MLDVDVDIDVGVDVDVGVGVDVVVDGGAALQATPNEIKHSSA